jgi:hypothetical protein
VVRCCRRATSSMSCETPLVSRGTNVAIFVISHSLTQGVVAGVDSDVAFL